MNAYYLLQESTHNLLTGHSLTGLWRMNLPWEQEAQAILRASLPMTARMTNGSLGITAGRIAMGPMTRQSTILIATDVSMGTRG